MTGERTASNARRLGLSLSVLADPVFSEQVAALTRRIAGEASDGNSFELARRIAEAQIDLQRVRQARHQFFADRLRDLDHPSSPSLDPHKLAAILVQHSNAIKAIDRYERRASSRRKFSIRALDDCLKRS